MKNKIPPASIVVNHNHPKPWGRLMLAEFDSKYQRPVKARRKRGPNFQPRKKK